MSTWRRAGKLMGETARESGDGYPEGKGQKSKVRREILAACLADNVKARELMPDGSYVRVSRGADEAVINSEERLLGGDKI